MKQEFECYLNDCPVIAILRGISIDEIKPVCDALFSAGIKLLEIPLNTPNALGCIARAVKHCGTRQMIGAGTVLTATDVQNVKNSCGKFIISPNTDVNVIKETKKLNLVSIPGFFTASEAFVATSAGADYLKLFPSILGPGYVKDLKAVVKLPILAVGGVKLDNVASFMKVCCGVGIGGALYKTGKNINDVARDAKEFAKLCKNNN